MSTTFFFKWQRERDRKRGRGTKCEQLVNLGKGNGLLYYALMFLWAWNISK